MMNSIADVPGVGIGHLTVDAGAVQTGATVIVPYPLSIRNRKLFIGSFASGGWQEWTSRQVSSDFGTFSSPIVLCNSTTIGIAYDALITLGHQRADDLPIDNAWPPLVIGIDDGFLNDQRQRRLDHDAILQLVLTAADAPPSCGSVGIGRGLCALGGKGGVGEASRLLRVGGDEAVVGALVAANGGRLRNGGTGPAVASLTPSTVAVIATTLPLLPVELSALAEACIRGLDEIIAFGADDRQLALAFSTGNAIENSFEEVFHLKAVRHHPRHQLQALFDAGAEAIRAAFERALAEAEPVTGRRGRYVAKVEVPQWKARK